MTWDDEARHLLATATDELDRLQHLVSTVLGTPLGAPRRRALERLHRTLGDALCTTDPSQWCAACGEGAPLTCPDCGDTVCELCHDLLSPGAVAPCGGCGARVVGSGHTPPAPFCATCLAQINRLPALDGPEPDIGF